MLNAALDEVLSFAEITLSLHNSQLVPNILHQTCLRRSDTIRLHAGLEHVAVEDLYKWLLLPAERRAQRTLETRTYSLASWLHQTLPLLVLIKNVSFGPVQKKSSMFRSSDAPQNRFQTSQLVYGYTTNVLLFVEGKRIG